MDTLKQAFGNAASRIGGGLMYAYERGYDSLAIGTAYGALALATQAGLTYSSSPAETVGWLALTVGWLLMGVAKNTQYQDKLAAQKPTGPV